jgi:hypothetical protein
MASLETGRSFIREYGPTVLYGLVTVGGMIFIWTSKLLGWPTTLVTAVPLALMGVYFVSAFILGGLRLHNEQAGDNLYYMGFLFTLSSLGVSLYLFAGETSIDTIVRNFGIAVTSTIAGVTLRILFNQMRRDPIDIERSARHELAEMTRRVRSELDSSSREFSNYRRVSNQMLEEGFEEIARQAERNGEEIRKSIDSLSKDAIKPIQEAAEKLSAIMVAHSKSVDDRATDAARNMTEATSKLAEIITRFGSTVEAVGTKLEELKLPEDAHSSAAQVETAIAPLKEIEAKMERVLEALDRAASEPEKVQVVGPQEILPVPQAISLPDRSLTSAEDKVAPPSNDDKIAHGGDDQGVQSRSGTNDEDDDEPRRRWFRW